MPMIQLCTTVTTHRWYT